IEEPLVATVMLFALLALGEVISIYSKARIPMLMTAMIGYLLLTWTGVFPENILELSTLPALGALLIGPLIIHMGTLMPLSILKKTMACSRHFNQRLNRSACFGFINCSFSFRF